MEWVNREPWMCPGLLSSTTTVCDFLCFAVPGFASVPSARLLGFFTEAFFIFLSSLSHAGLGFPGRRCLCAGYFPTPLVPGQLYLRALLPRAPGVRGLWHREAFYLVDR